ncbi:MAG: hypothetical protein DM484_28305 [Candidatus Methylumidiphilus alinenensis]|uniref:TrfA protein n=1 Tax=Candidatus Methylumidiphilus alinenensis TaxID=2202197 RepID=A0A2W4QE75_9GAMM|nr:MAG: hypothetical protein DM484_28305 [Candidatus Methylumidiphilus alinenensis]
MKKPKTMKLPKPPASKEDGGALYVDPRQTDLFKREPPVPKLRCVAKLERIAEEQRLKRERREEEERLERERLAAVNPRLPPWPDTKRAVPNLALRSALFAAVRHNKRLFKYKVASVDGVDILYTGEQLDQTCLDVWEAVMHLCRHQQMGTELEFSAYEFLKMLEKADTGKNRKDLDDDLTRLNACAVRVQVGKRIYQGGLVVYMHSDENSQYFKIGLDPKLLLLFDTDQYTLLDWAIRKDLSGKPLAQWLHGYFASHAKPYPITFAKIHELCGSESKDMPGFRRDVRKALQTITEVCAKHGKPFSVEFKEDRVIASPTPSSSQQRCLEKKPPD